jgi:threonine/homoserine/homoserine lactone efflux protein
MSIHGLLSFAFVYLVFVITPGPGIGAMVARGLGIGMRHAVPFVAGFVLGDIVWFTIAASGLAALANSFALAFTAVKYAGCLYLLYLAWKMWTAPVAAGDVRADTAQTTAWGSFAGSLSLTLSNPKVIVFFLSLMPLVVDVRGMTFQAYGAMAAIMAVVCGGNGLVYLGLASRARKLFTSATALRRINRSAAVLVAGAAGMIAVKG